MNNQNEKFKDWSLGKCICSYLKRIQISGNWKKIPGRVIISLIDISYSGKKILDPRGPFLHKWNKIFVWSCVVAAYLDPLFFYIPVINGDRNCLGLDNKLQIVASVLRSVADVFYVLHIIFQFRTAYIVPSSRVFGSGELVEDTVRIARRYISSFFMIDILAVLPLPQVAVLIIIPKLHGSAPQHTKNFLRYVVFLQYFPRLLRLYPLYKQVTGISGIYTQTPWVGAALNLFLYMLFSHMFGASWYLLGIERKDRCWRDACGNTAGCDPSSLYCGVNSPVGANAFLNASCPLTESDTAPFDFGIYRNVLKSGVVESTDLMQKLSYCMWWGLQSLSSLGQNLETSTFVGEIYFAVSISIFGLILFALLIGNVQRYLQSYSARLEEMFRVKREDAEQWMSHRLLPEHLRERIRQYEQYKWQETRGVDEYNLISNFPRDLRRDIKSHLYLDLLRRVPIFEQMDEQLLHATCERLKQVFCAENSYIVREGDSVDDMLFIMRGSLLTVTTNGGRTGFYNSEYLKAGDFCGEELLTWALDPRSSSNLPNSTRTVQCLTAVEAVALGAYDLKSVASQIRQIHSEKFQHTFRFYSPQWRTWAACFIQAAWRRYHKKKLEESLFEAENRLKNALAKGGGSSPSLGAAIYVSRFSSNALRVIRHHGLRKTRLPESTTIDASEASRD